MLWEAIPHLRACHNKAVLSDCTLLLGHREKRGISRKACCAASSQCCNGSMLRHSLEDDSHFDNLPMYFLQNNSDVYRHLTQLLSSAAELSIRWRRKFGLLFKPQRIAPVFHAAHHRLHTPAWHSSAGDKFC